MADSRERKEALKYLSTLQAQRQAAAEVEREAKKAEREAAVAPPPAPVKRAAPAAAKKTAAPPAPKVTEPAKAVEPVVVEAPKFTLPPDIQRDVDYRAAWQASTGLAEEVASFAAKDLGMSKKEFQRVAEAQGVSLADLYEARRKGRTFDEYAKMARERGVIGFMPVAEREAAFRRTVDTAEKAMQGVAPDTIGLKKAGADSSFSPSSIAGGATVGALVGAGFGGVPGALIGASIGGGIGAASGYTVMGTSTVFPEVSKPGEHGHTLASMLVGALKNDTNAVRLYDLYGRGLATGNTQRYIEDRTQELLRRSGTSPGTAAAAAIIDRLRRQALNEVIAYKTVGQWTPAVTLQDVEVTEGAAPPGVFDALKPNVELIGFNNQNQAVFRQESPLGVLFRTIDIPQEAAVGALQGSAARGVQTGANFLELALETTEGASPFVQWPAVTAGFFASIFFPDLLLAGGAAYKGARAAAKTAKFHVAKKEAVALLEAVANARKAGDSAAAVEAESKLRRLLPAEADNLDRFDAAVADTLRLHNPETDIYSEDMAALLGSRPGQFSEVAQRESIARVWQHPSMRKEVLAAKLKSRDIPTNTYAELFDTARHKARIDAAEQDYLANAPKTVDDYTKNYARGAAKYALSELVDRAARSKGGMNVPALSGESVDRLAEIVADASLLLKDIGEFRRAVTQALMGDDVFRSDAYKLVRNELAGGGENRLAAQLERKIQSIRGKSINDLQAEDLALFKRARTAIEQNNEARGMAAALLHEEIAKRGNLQVQPLKVFDDVLPRTVDGEPLRLSPGGSMILYLARNALPNVEFRDLVAGVSMLDQAIISAAKKQGRDPYDLLRELVVDIRKGTPEDLQRLLGVKAKAPAGAPPTPSAPAAAAPATSAGASTAAARLDNMRPPLPVGTPIGDVQTLDDAMALLQKALTEPTALVQFSARTADNAGDAKAIIIGDVRIVVDYAPDKVAPRVFVRVGTAPLKVVKAPAGSRKKAFEAGLAEAKKLIEARITKNEPAIKGAPVVEAPGYADALEKWERAREAAVNSDPRLKKATADAAKAVDVARKARQAGISAERIADLEASANKAVQVSFDLDTRLTADFARKNPEPKRRMVFVAAPPAAAPTPVPAPATAVAAAPAPPKAAPGVLPVLADTVEARKEQLRTYLRANPGVYVGDLFGQFRLLPADVKKIHAEVKAERAVAAAPAPAAPTPEAPKAAAPTPAAPAAPKPAPSVAPTPDPARQEAEMLRAANSKVLAARKRVSAARAAIDEAELALNDARAAKREADSKWFGGNKDAARQALTDASARRMAAFDEERSASKALKDAIDEKAGVENEIAREVARREAQLARERGAVLTPEQERLISGTKAEIARKAARTPAQVLRETLQPLRIVVTPDGRIFVGEVMQEDGGRFVRPTGDYQKKDFSKLEDFQRQLAKDFSNPDMEFAGTWPVEIPEGSRITQPDIEKLASFVEPAAPVRAAAAPAPAAPAVVPAPKVEAPAPEAPKAAAAEAPVTPTPADAMSDILRADDAWMEAIRKFGENSEEAAAAFERRQAAFARAEAPTPPTPAIAEPPTPAPITAAAEAPVEAEKIVEAAAEAPVVRVSEADIDKSPEVKKVLKARNAAERKLKIARGAQEEAAAKLEATSTAASKAAQEKARKAAVAAEKALRDAEAADAAAELQYQAARNAAEQRLAAEAGKQQPLFAAPRVEVAQAEEYVPPAPASIVERIDDAVFEVDPPTRQPVENVKEAAADLIRKIKVGKSYSNDTGRRFTRAIMPDGTMRDILVRGPSDGSAPNAWGDFYPVTVTSVPKVRLKAAESDAKKLGQALDDVAEREAEQALAKIDEQRDFAKAVEDGEVVTQGELRADMNHLIDTLGANMYNKPIAEVAVKELVQNSFDAVKSAVASGQIKQGDIVVKFLPGTRSIEVTDNGVGMSADTVQNAMFTIAGTHKPNLSEAQRSGGLGMAKMAFLFGSKEIELTTVKDGVQTYVRTNPKEIRASNFKIVQRKAPGQPNGTTMRVAIPESYFDASKGENVSIYFSPYPSSYSFLSKSLIGPTKITTIDGFGTAKTKLAAPAEDMVKLTSAKFSWGTADIYVSNTRSKYPVHTVLSSGLYQFDYDIAKSWDDKFPYDVVIDVKPNVDTKHPHYPFTPQRENFRGTINEDLTALKAYMMNYARGLDAERTANTFKTAVRMERVGLESVGGDINQARAAILKRFSAEAGAARKAAAQAPPPPAEIVIRAGEAKDVKTGEVVARGEDLTTAPTRSERTAKASFKADKKVTGGAEFFSSQAVDPKTPLFHNNTSVDYVQAARDAGHDPEAFFTLLGSVVVEFRERAAKQPGYEVLENAYAAGVSIDKEYKGVHVRVPYLAFFVNPLAHGGETPVGAAESMMHTLIHEAVHTRVSKHNEDFTIELGRLYEKLADSADVQAFRTALEKALSQHWDTFLFLRSKYDEYSTKNLARSMGSEPGADSSRPSSFYAEAAAGPSGVAEGGGGARRGGGGAGLVEDVESAARNASSAGADATRSVILAAVSQESAPTVAQAIAYAKLAQVRIDRLERGFLDRYGPSALGTFVLDESALRGSKVPVSPDGLLTAEEAADLRRLYSERESYQRLASAAPTPSGIPAAPLRQVGPTGEVKGLVETVNDGRSVIYLFENADVSTLLHEFSHIFRRRLLDATDMERITDWIRTQGVDVKHEFGEFVGSDANIEKAEELFGVAFERYIMNGEAPTPGLRDAFDTLKQAMAKVYQNVKSPVVGLRLSDEVRAVFDKMVEDVPAASFPSLREVFRREMLGRTEEAPGFIDRLAAEAQRKGIPRASVEDLQKQFDIALSKNEDPQKPYISFPSPVLGKRDWTFNEIAEAQTKLAEEGLNRAARLRGPKMNLGAKIVEEAAVIEEDSPVESLRSALTARKDDAPTTARARTVLRSVAGTFFGGDVVGEKGARLLPPEMRKALDAVERRIEESIGDTVSLINDVIEVGQPQALESFLAGGVKVARAGGRPIVSAGHDYMGSFRQMIGRAFDALSPDERQALNLWADIRSKKNWAELLPTIGYSRTFEPIENVAEAVEKTRNNLGSAVTKLLYKSGSAKDELGIGLAQAIARAVQAPQVARPSHEFKMVELMTYIAGKTGRPADGAPVEAFGGTSREAVRLFLNEAGSIYDEASKRRLAVVIGGYGAADLAKLTLVKLNLGVSKEAADAFQNWIVGQSWPGQYTEEIQRILSRYGVNPDFVSDTVLGVDFYIPKEARTRMADALARVNYRPAEAATGVDAFNNLYRYMKKRMTSGNFFLRQRYYMMNTVDHFIQLGMTAGFGVAANSVTRVIAQDLMVLPFWQQLVDVARKLPGGQRIPRDILERARRGLQAGGDVLGNRIGQLFGVSKYRIEVNPILEGLDGGFRAGNKVYSYREIRNIAVEEGIFASFNTRQLTNAIQREGALYINREISRWGEVAGAGAPALEQARGNVISGKLRNFLADWEQTVSDTAEAWGERERIGAMVALMEAGHDPRTAARLTIDALYDYSQSMTKADRSIIVGIMFPFWAFQKNANAQVFNQIFSPWGAYRMMAIRRARERSAELLTAILYGEVAGEYGLDVESMPPDLQDSYYSLVTEFESAYDGDPPKEAKRAFRMLLTGVGTDVEEGYLYQLSPNLLKMREEGRFAELSKFGGYVQLAPSAASRMTYLRERAGIGVRFPRTEAVRLYYSLLGDEHAYMEVFLPESSIEGGFRHITQLVATYTLMAASAGDLLAGGALTEKGLREVKVTRVLEPVFDPERSPILGPLIADMSIDAMPPKRLAKGLIAVGGAGQQVATKIHPLIGKLIDDLYGTTLLRTPADVDPFVVDPTGKNLQQLTPEQVERIKALQAEYPDAGTLRDQRYYIPGGVWSMAFENTPFLGELNALLIRWEEEPLERMNLRGEILRLSRFALGIDVSMTSSDRAARFEEPKKLRETKGL